MSPLIQALLQQFMQRTDAKVPMQGTGGGAAPGGVAPGAVPYAGGGDPSGFAQGNTLPQSAGGGTPGEYSLGDARLEAIRRPRR